MNQRHTYRRRFWMFPFFALAAILLLGNIIRWLWNAILPDLLNVNPISYWQSVGLLALCRLLFGNFGGRRGGPGRWRGQPRFSRESSKDDKRGFGPPWKNKWMEMTEAERSKFRQEMRRRCGKPPENDL
ncbi:hypothetical protein [Dyadobacter sediminis]|uniref:DUF1682 domain-containing protein n=1 Tax=Dyadobacter sediminis TaxID=1493691 RepID=A0A5R9KAB2_9BACT|nr:hypothetical protein [Dyadobacter sediminis]TLU91771.1 hypothetical protein FEM55_13395 [Dyadobacter sediminis]